ncbi:MAG: NUMOD3 domain-containing DNA-binding protein [Bacteroidales bacterium]|jgi:hypothetical protein
MSTTFKPYTYLIGWSSLNKFYYGVQYNKKANPSNLWTTYFTSSKYVKEFRELYGEPDIVQIRKTFETKEKAIQWEFKVIQRLNIVRSKQWLNRSLAGQKFYNSIGLRGQNNPNFGKIFSEETRLKMSISGKNRIFSEEHKNKISITKCGQNNPMFGKIHTEKTKQRISISAKNRPKFECPHCNKLFNQLNLNRWHDDNCKFKK